MKWCFDQCIQPRGLPTPPDPLYQPLSSEPEVLSRELQTLDSVISKGRTMPQQGRTAFDLARRLKHVPLLGIPYVQNDGAIAQYWATNPSASYIKYVSLGLVNHYSGSHVGYSIFMYEPKVGTFRNDRFIKYLSASGLSTFHVEVLREYLEAVTTNSRMNWLQAEVMAQRSGFYALLRPFFTSCRLEKVQVRYLHCILRGRQEPFAWDRSNGNKKHFERYHAYACGNEIGRCHFPGCDIVFANFTGKENPEAIQERDEHIRSCPHKSKLIPSTF